MNHADVVVIGAGASGLAAGATLGALGREPVLLERDARVGGTWDRRYERLCLHTVRQFSGLPHLPMPGSFPRYVPKGMYTQYLRDYAPGWSSTCGPARRSSASSARLDPAMAGW